MKTQTSCRRLLMSALVPLLLTHTVSGAALQTGSAMPSATESTYSRTDSYSQSPNRLNSPIFNVWEFVRGAGSANARAGVDVPAEFQNSRLNRCEWAIISCCSTVETRRRHECFEALHCSGAWFANPCTQRLQRAVFEKLLELEYSGVKG